MNKKYFMYPKINSAQLGLFVFEFRAPLPYQPLDLIAFSVYPCFMTDNEDNMIYYPVLRANTSTNSLDKNIHQITDIRHLISAVSDAGYYVKPTLISTHAFEYSGLWKVYLFCFSIPQYEIQSNWLYHFCYDKFVWDCSKETSVKRNIFATVLCRITVGVDGLHLGQALLRVITIQFRNWKILHTNRSTRENGIGYLCLTLSQDIDHTYLCVVNSLTWKRRYIAINNHFYFCHHYE